MNLFFNVNSVSLCLYYKESIVDMTFCKHKIYILYTDTVCKLVSVSVDIGRFWNISVASNKMTSSNI